MHLDNILALTHGILETAPTVSVFDEIAIDVKKIRRGMLFIALNHHDIDQAVEQGAYGVIYDRDLHVHDQDVAWIRVEDIYDALKRIVRFILIDREYTAFTCNPITIQIAKQLWTSESCLILEGSLQENFSRIMSARPHSMLLYSENDIQGDLFTNAQPLPDDISSPIEIIEQTLFETSFIYKDQFYERQLLSPFFIPYLEQLLQLFDERGIEFRIRPFTTLRHFQPVFTNAALHVKDFGSSDRVIIFESDFTLIRPQIDFMNRQASWARILYLLPRKSYQNETFDQHILFYDTTRDIIEALKNNRYHFALVAGCDKSILESASAQIQRTQPTLF